MQNLLKALGDRRQQLRENGEGQKGFTLVELLVVVIIIGILAGIAIPVFLNQRTSAWQAEVESSLQNAALAAETHAVQNNGSYATLDATTLAAAGYRASGDTVVTVTATANGFVLTGVNSNLPADADTLTYNSNDGGLADEFTAGG